MPTVLEWNPTVDPSEFVSRVREALAAGEAVVLPGDVGYCLLVNPRSPAAVRCLDICADPPALLAYSADDALNVGLTAPLAAARLMQRAWPAPLALALPAATAKFPTEWPAALRDRLAAAGFIRFRCPEHPAIESLFPAILDGDRCPPILIFDTYSATAAELVDKLGDAAGLAVSAGEIVPGRLTVVQAAAGGWKLEQEGDFTAADVQRLTARIVLFVCTGNTCRSPLAEGLARKMLSDRFGCPALELPARGIWVLSAGVSAYGGAPASPESVDVAAEFGADLLSHRSRPVNPQLLAAADDVIAMTRGHALALAAGFPGIGPPPRLLCGDGDLDDPIGASLDVYRECARTITNQLERFLTEWVRP
ncbi:MAG TPA: Sua5/YciO/YrdC/YwlC family protein [Gemmataceae bacterium]|jgi:protein-tyrosine phosphatase